MDSSPNVDALKEGMRYGTQQHRSLRLTLRAHRVLPPRRRLVVEVQLPRIKGVVALQTMMRLLGKDAPQELKSKLEVSLRFPTDSSS